MNYEELVVYVEGGTVRDIMFTAIECEMPSRAGKSLGFSARLRVDADAAGCGMIKAGRGEIKMQKVWDSEMVGEGGQRQTGRIGELWEGWWGLDVRYGPTLKREHGRGEKYTTTFWAVRAKKDKDGREIGIDP
jgi:hypothetical protein